MADLSHTVIYESAGELLAELANETGRPVSWAVLNAHRELLHYTRMDGAPYRSSVLSHNKGYSAVWFGRDSVEIEKMVGSRGIAAYGDPNLTSIGGGVLIKDKDGAVVAARGGERTHHGGGHRGGRAAGGQDEGEGRNLMVSGAAPDPATR